MAIDIKSLSQLITEFRALQSKDAISPDSLGYILQRIADLLATAGTSDTITKIQNLLDGFARAGVAISTFEQGAADRNNILVNSKEVDLSSGAVGTRTNNLFIKQATTERAGAMRAQQVVDLNNARNRIAEILPLLEQIQAKLGMTDGSKGLYNTAQISVMVENGYLKIYGAQQLIADGYVPYLFRHTRKRNQWKDRVVIEGGGQTRKYCDPRKGWNLYGSIHTIKLSGTTLTFSENAKVNYCKPGESYSALPDVLVSHHIQKDGTPTFGWGRSVVSLLDPKNSKKHRMIRLRFAIGFAKKISPGRSLLTTANLVSSLAEFSLIYNPNTKSWSFGK